MLYLQYFVSKRLTLYIMVVFYILQRLVSFLGLVYSTPLQMKLVFADHPRRVIATTESMATERIHHGTWLTLLN